MRLNLEKVEFLDCNSILEANNEDDFCKKCVADFDKVGGCKCMASDDCDQLSLIPEGCFKCGQKAMEYCDLKEGKNKKNL